MVQIIPAILATTPEDYKRETQKLNNSQSFKEGWVHIDFADKKLVPNQTIDIDEVNKYPLDLKKEAHLMVINPLNWIEDLKNAGFYRIVFHFESENNPEEVVQAVKDAGMEVGIAINPDTKIDSLKPFKDTIDQILVMGIVPGFQGQPFIPATIDKIKDLKLKSWPVKISTDGAVRDTNAKNLADAGVDQLVCGSFLLKGDVDENLEKLWEAINS